MAAKAIILYGVPGAGKGTQANLLARSQSWIHFDTGPYLKDLLYDEENLKDPEMQKQRKVWDAGHLNDPLWVLEITSNFAKQMGECKQSIVFSGSPRTVLEAFGNDDHEGLLSVLENTYGKDYVKFFFLEVPPGAGGLRNKDRRHCSSCKLLILSNEETKDLEHCVTCGAPLEYRVILDAPQKYAKRLEEFNNRTLPVVEKLKEEGVPINTINAARAPFEIQSDILSSL